MSVATYLVTRETMPVKMLETAAWESLPGILSRSHQDTMPLPKGGGGLSWCVISSPQTRAVKDILRQGSLLMYFKPQQGGGGLIHPEGGVAWALCPNRME